MCKKGEILAIVIITFLMVLPLFSQDKSTEKIPMSGVVISNQKINQWQEWLSVHNHNVIESCSVEDAYCLALLLHPKLNMQLLSLDEIDQEIHSINKWNNPHFSTEWENINEYFSEEIEDLDFTCKLSLEIPSILKRKRKKDVLFIEKKLIELKNDFESRKLLFKINQKCIELSQMNEKVENFETIYDLVFDLHKISVKKLLLGRASQLDTIKTFIQKKRAETELNKVKGKFKTILLEIPLALGGKDLHIKKILASYSCEPVGPVDKHFQLFKMSNISFHIQKLATNLKEEEIKVLKSDITPQFELSFGVNSSISKRKFSYSSELGFPIPMVHFNIKEIRKAKIALRKHKLKESDVILSAREKIVTLVNNLHSLYSEIETLNTAIVPSSAYLYESAKIGYESGKFSILEIIQTQKEYFAYILEMNEKKTEYLIRNNELEMFVNQAMAVQ